MCIWNVTIEERHCNLCKQWHCLDRSNKSTWTGFASKLRKLKVNQFIEVPIESYNSVKTQVCRYNKVLINSHYIVRKKYEKVLVLRTK